MSNRDIRVSLTPEGVADVIKALRAVQSEGANASRLASTNLESVRGALSGIRQLLPAISFVTITAGMTGLARAAFTNAKNLVDLQESLGGTVEDLSALQTLFQRNNVGDGAMSQSLVRVARNLDDLNKGSQQTVDTFEKLGLSARDFEGLDITQSFSLIAQRMALLPSSVDKGALAFDLFGRSSDELSGILQELGVKGFSAVAAEAANAGRIVSTETALAVKQADESLRNLTGAAQGVATEFVAGLAPSVTAAMQELEKETRGRGVSSVREWGQETGRILLTVVATFRTFAVAVRDLVVGTTNQLGGLSNLFGATFAGDFREAGRIWKQMGEDGRADFETFENNFKENLQRIATEATRETPAIEIPLAPVVDPEARRKAEEQLRRTLEEIRNRETAKRAKVEAERQAKDRLAGEKAASEAIFELDQRLLELRGQGREVQLRAVDAEIAKYKQILTDAGQLTDDALAKLKQFRDLSVVRLDAEDTTAAGESALVAFNRDAEQIRRDQEAGLITQLEGENRLIALERDRLGVLRQLASQLLAAAEATKTDLNPLGNQQLIAQAQQYAASIDEIAASFQGATDASALFRQGFETGLQGSLENFLANAEDIRNLGDAFRSLALDIVQSLQQIAAEFLAKQATLFLMKSLFSSLGGGGGLQEVSITGAAATRMAGGGRVVGPGTETSDSIPAWLSKGEHVIRARAANQPGARGFLQAFNLGHISMEDVRLGMTAHLLPLGALRLAAGGPVESVVNSAAAAEFAAPASAAGPAGLAGVLGLEEGLVMKHLESNGFDRLLVKKAQRNKNGLRRLLGISK